MDLEACLMSDFSRRIVVLKFSPMEIYFAENVTKGGSEVFCQSSSTFVSETKKVVSF